VGSKKAWTLPAKQLKVAKASKVMRMVLMMVGWGGWEAA
jgi:hypothetical protein